MGPNTSAGQTDVKNQNNALEIERLRKAYNLSLFGLGLAALLVVVLVFSKCCDAAGISSIVGLFTSVLGTLVGAFFGLQIGSAGKEKAEERADNAQKKADVLGAYTQPEMMQAAMQKFPDLFK
jgi:hypothetical protein